MIAGRYTLEAEIGCGGMGAVWRGRDEVLVPAYTCFSIPASAVAAGLCVRLVDVTLSGRIDAKALDPLPLEGAADLRL